MLQATYHKKDAKHIGLFTMRIIYPLDSAPFYEKAGPPVSGKPAILFAVCQFGVFSLRQNLTRNFYRLSCT